MYIKLTKSFLGKKEGRIIEIEDKFWPFIFQNKAGVQVPAPEKVKVKEEKEAETRETKEEKQPKRRRRKTTKQ